MAIDGMSIVPVDHYHGLLFLEIFLFGVCMPVARLGGAGGVARAIFQVREVMWAVVREMSRRSRAVNRGHWSMEQVRRQEEQIRRLSAVCLSKQGSLISSCLRCR